MDLSGELSLNQAFRQEFRIGKQALPRCVQLTFPPNLDTLLNALEYEQKYLRVLIRDSREKTHTFLYTYAFSATN